MEGEQIARASKNSGSPLERGHEKDCRANESSANDEVREGMNTEK